MKKIFAILLLPMLGWATLNGKNDIQYWQMGALKKEINDKFAFLFFGEARFGNTASKFYFGYLQAQAAYLPTSWLVLAPGYRQIYKRYPLNSDHLRPGYSPLFDLVLKGLINHWELGHRSRIQYIIFESDPSHWLYRDLVRITTPSSWNSYRVSLYLENEFFWRERKGISQERVTVGLEKVINSYFRFQMFYMARFLNREPNWIYQTVFGTDFIFNF